jgi:hypothetical protein
MGATIKDIQGHAFGHIIHDNDIISGAACPRASPDRDSYRAEKSRLARDVGSGDVVYRHRRHRAFRIDVSSA